MFFSPYEPLLAAGNAQELSTELLKAAGNLDFAYFSGIVILDLPDGTKRKIGFENIPPTYRDSYLDERLTGIDPVMAHCKRSSLPITWGQDIYVQVQQGHIHEHMRANGFNAGVCTASHLPNGVHFLFGLDRPDKLPEAPGELQQVVAEVQLLSVHAQEAALRLTRTASNDPEAAPDLTARELEVLKWAMAGKTAWETGAILKISQRTATVHITNAMRKLGAVKKHQAVIRALQLGLIT